MRAVPLTSRALLGAAAIVALACSDGTAPGPADGTITGTVSRADVTIASSGAMMIDFAGATSAAARSAADRMSIGAPRRLTVGAAAPVDEPAGALIVRFRRSALGIPSAADVRGRGMATQIAARMRERLDVAVRSRGARIQGTSPAMLAARIAVDPVRAAEVRASLMRDPSIASVEYDVRLRRSGDAVREVLPLEVTGRSNDPGYVFQSWHYGMIELPAAWRMTRGSASVVVAVIDDGIRFDHPDLFGVLTNDGYDFVMQDSVTLCNSRIDDSGDEDGYDPDPTIPASYDCENGSLVPSKIGGHGLHVAGTIGARGNDQAGLTGVNWTVSIRPIRVLGVSGSGFSYDVAQGILYAAGLPADDGNGGTVQAPTPARIINLSLGGGSTTVLQDAVRAATAAGSLIIAAAGNDGKQLAHYPAAYQDAVSVAAVGPDRRRASYSNFHSTVDIAAPGGDFIDDATQGASFGVASTTWDFGLNEPTYAYYQGTSMATPHVSGVAALILAAEPGLTPVQLFQRLTEYSIDAGFTGRDEQYGHGILNARNSLDQTHEPVAATYALLYDARTGAHVATAPATGSDRRFTFGEIARGTYHLYAGDDAEADARVGIPGRRWGVHGSAVDKPTGITVRDSRAHTVAMTIGEPRELEPNDTRNAAGRIVVGGWVSGEIGKAADADWYRVPIAESGEYTFETTGSDGACGFALESDTKLQLLNGSGTEIVLNADRDTETFDFCSLVRRTLSAGTYYLLVTGEIGRYRLQVRAGP